MATLSLYVFNLLPLPYLDGTELFKELIDMALEDRVDVAIYDIESFEQGPNRGRRWQKRLMKLLHPVVALVMTLYVLLALMNTRQ
jgi:S2P endopeptidase